MTQMIQKYIQGPQEKNMQKDLDLHLSLHAITTIGAVPNCCFDNAWRTFCSMPTTFTDGRFVEGWIVFDQEDEVVLNEHGWCEHANGQIVDPSVLLLVPFEMPVYYFSGVTRDWQEIMALQDHDVWLPYVRFDGKHGNDGLGHPHYKAAYDLAKQKVTSLAQATQPSKRMTFLTAQNIEDDQDNTPSAVQIFLLS